MRRLVDGAATLLVAFCGAGPLVVSVGAMVLAAAVIVELWRHYMGVF